MIWIPGLIEFLIFHSILVSHFRLLKFLFWVFLTSWLLSISGFLIAKMRVLRYIHKSRYRYHLRANQGGYNDATFLKKLMSQKQVFEIFKVKWFKILKLMIFFWDFRTFCELALNCLLNYVWKFHWMAFLWFLSSPNSHCDKTHFLSENYMTQCEFAWSKTSYKM